MSRKSLPKNPNRPAGSGIIILLITLGLCSAPVEAQQVTGRWLTIDDETGEEKSVVEIYEEEGELFGKIVEIRSEEDEENVVCEQCSGRRKNQPVLGMVIIEGLTRNGNRYEGGTILDPESGNRYKCYIEPEDDHTLKVRGYRGIALLGRTQYWQMVEE